MAAFKFDPIDLDGPAFRLIRLLKGKGPTIRCELFQAWLNPDTLIPYEALSYVWGSNHKDDRIQVNGLPMDVTINLYSVLQRLRYEDRDRILWIDAISIDQSNPKERGHQVNRMAEIYKLADQVIIWLGVSTDEIVIAMHGMEQLQARTSNRATHDWKTSDERWMTIWRSIQPFSDKESTWSTTRQRAGMEALLARPWFKRVWILQEVAHARSAVCICGNTTVQARFLAIMPHLLGVKPDTQSQAVLDIIPGCPRNNSWWSQNRELRTLLEKFRACKAGDSRDRIYALLNMSTDTDDTSFPKADYEKDDWEVIHDTLLYLLPFKSLGSAAGGLESWTIENFLGEFHLLVNKVFALAIEHGELLIAKVLVARKDFDKNARDEHGHTPLWWAAKYGHHTLVDILINMGANVNETIKGKDSAVIEASSNGHFEVLRLFVENGAKIDIKDGYAGRAIVQASSNGYHGVVRLLIECGVNLNVKDDGGKNALSQATLNGHHEVVRLLLERRVDIKPLNWGREGQFCKAASKGYHKIVRLFIDYCPDAVRRVGKYALMQAALNDHREVVELLLMEGRADSGEALVQASSKGYYEVVQLLINSGADVNARDGLCGQTALEHAVDTQRGDIMQLLLDHGADANAKASVGATALFRAAELGRKDLVQELLNHGAETNLTDFQGRTALFSACRSGDEGTVRVLLDNGAHANVKTVSGATLLSYAADLSDEDIVRLLLLHQADVNARNSNGRTPLWYAASSGRTNIAQLLVEEYGADPSVRDYNGTTAFSKAVSNGHEEVRQLFADYGVNANEEDEIEAVQDKPGSKETQHDVLPVGMDSRPTKKARI